MLMFLLSLIAFISTALLSVLLAQDLYEKGFGKDAEDRIANSALTFGMACTLVVTMVSLLQHAV